MKILLWLATLAAFAESPKNLMDLKCDEKAALRDGKGRAERRGRELLLWLPGYFPKESAVLFRNPDPPNATKFVYCGGRENFEMVFENFDHDAPMLYLVQANGRKLFFHVGEDAVYARGHELAAVSLGRAPEVRLWEARPESQGSYSGRHYELALRCATEAAKRPPDLSVVSWGDGELKIRAPEGEATFERTTTKWTLKKSTGHLTGLKCDDPR